MVLQHQHKSDKWFSTLARDRKVVSTPTLVRKVVVNAIASAKCGSATLAQVRKVVFNTSISAENGFATLTQLRKVVLQH